MTRSKRETHQRIEDIAREATGRFNIVSKRTDVNTDDIRSIKKWIIGVGIASELRSIIEWMSGLF